MFLFKVFFDLQLFYRRFLFLCAMNSYSERSQKQRVAFRSVQNYDYQMPKRQGKGFRIDLGLNTGPFLPQDISSTNQKSKTLLAARQILQSHISMSSLLENLQAKQNMMIKSFPSSLPEGYKIQNFNAKFNYLFEQVKMIGELSQKLSVENKKLKSEIQKSYEKFENLNNQMVQNCTPIFRNLLKTIRSAHEDEKNMFEREKRELEGLQKFRSAFIEKIVQFQSKILKLEHTLGIRTLGDDSDENFENIQENYDKYQY